MKSTFIIKEKEQNRSEEVEAAHTDKVSDKTPPTSFFKKLFFGPHTIEGEPIDELEDEAVMQQLAWWSRME